MALRAREVVWPPTLVHVGSYALVMVPLCWWLALGEGPGRGHGVWGVLAGVAVASVIAGILQTLLLEREAGQRGFVRERAGDVGGDGAEVRELRGDEAGDGRDRAGSSRPFGG